MRTPKNPRRPQTAEFASRLATALDQNRECPPYYRGRFTWLRDKLARSGIHVTVETISKWASGDASPRPDKAKILASVLDVELAWLLLGNTPMAIKDQPVDSSQDRKLAINEPLKIVIRPGVVVELSGIPLDLKTIEATKIANIVLAHSIGV